MSDHLTIDPLPEKFDRILKAADRRSDRSWDVNLTRLECSCPEWQERRAGFSPKDARRVCEHIYDKLYSTKAEKSFSPLLQLFIRYGRTMFDCREVSDDFGTFVIGQPFGPGSLRAIGVMQGKSVLATYNFDHGGHWSGGETPLTEEEHARILERMRAVWPSAFA